MTISFHTLAFSHLFHVPNMRDASAGSVGKYVTHNPYVWLALLLCATLLVSTAYLPTLSSVVELKPPEPSGWTVILVLAFLLLLAGEAACRFYVRRTALDREARIPMAEDPRERSSRRRVAHSSCWQEMTKTCGAWRVAQKMVNLDQTYGQNGSGGVTIPVVTYH